MDAVGTAIRCHGNNVARGREMKNTRKDPGPSCNYKDNRAAPAWKSSYALDVKRIGSDRAESGPNRGSRRIWSYRDGRKAKIVSLPHIWGGGKENDENFWILKRTDFASKRAFILRNNSERGVFSFFPFIVRIFPIRFDEHTFSRFKHDSTSIATRIRSVGF